MSAKTSQLSNPFSTGGGGSNFETHVQAAFAVLLLTNGFAPCPPPWPIKKIKLQGKYQGFDTDDLIVFSEEANGTGKAKLLVQVRHKIAITKGNREFSEVVQSAWNDFTNQKVFKTSCDSIALVTGPLSSTDMEVRTLLELARHADDAEDFILKVSKAHFSSENRRRKLDVIRHHLKKANKGTELTDEQLWSFLKSYHLLGYDLDIKAGVTLSLLQSLIGQYSACSVAEIWSMVCDEVRWANQNAGVITPVRVSPELRKYFQKRAIETIPESLTEQIPPPITIPWRQGPLANALAIAFLLGGWDEGTVADRNVAEQLANEEFVKWIAKLREIIQDPASPVTLRNRKWAVTRNLETWNMFALRLFDAHLDRLHEVATAVLSEPDPAFDLPANERYAARIHGKVLQHSRSLRKGLADALALLGSRPSALRNCSAHKPETVALSVVREILGQADWILWGSLDDLLPLLAEAAPEEFLNAVEQALQNKPCPFEELFGQESSGIMGRNYMVGLLWALETLAWDETYLSRVTLILGELSIIDPGGNWGNRPANSLRTIFLPWLPQTIATAEKRYAAIRALKKEVPTSAWNLLIGLLPKLHQSSSDSHKPVWRETIPADWKKGVTEKEYWDQVSHYADTAVEMASENLARLAELVATLDSLPKAAFEKLLDHISSSTVTGLPEEKRTPIWSALTEFAAKHRRYSDAPWALSADLVTKVERVAESLGPKSLISLYGRLFTMRDLDLYETDTEDWQKAEQHLEERRQDAVRKIYASGGIAEVLRLARSADSPIRVGASLGVIAQEVTDSEILPQLLKDDDRAVSEFVSGFVRARYQTMGREWADQICTSKWSASQIGRFLTYLPFTIETWKRAEELLGANETLYWSEVSFNPFQAAGKLDVAIDKLLKHNRPNAALDCLRCGLHRSHRLDRLRTVKALLAAVRTQEDPSVMDPHNVIELIKTLQDDPKTDRNDFCSIEWSYLPILDGRRGVFPKLLQRRLATEPHFFCEVIRSVFRSGNERSTETEPSEQEKNLALRAYQLLHGWKVPPGTLPSGGFAGENLTAWLEVVKSECEASGHLEVALNRVGNVLVFAPPDAAGLWIDRSVAEVLNTRDADAMRRGFRVGLMNLRGAHFVDPTGKPEKELARKYNQQADAVESAGYPRLASTLRGVADFYCQEAERIIAEHKEELEE